MFEVTIRYIGGLLGAYTLRGDTIMSEKAIALAQKLMVAFDSQSKMPMPLVKFPELVVSSPMFAYYPF